MYLEPMRYQKNKPVFAHMTGIHTLVSDLKYWPQNLIPLLSFVRGILCILHLVAEFEEGVFDVIKAIRRWLATAR